MGISQNNVLINIIIHNTIGIKYNIGILYIICIIYNNNTKYYLYLFILKKKKIMAHGWPIPLKARYLDTYYDNNE